MAELRARGALKNIWQSHLAAKNVQVTRNVDYLVCGECSFRTFTFLIRDVADHSQTEAMISRNA
jgi:hypothetical protein